VHKEKEEVKKTKKVFQEQWKKTKEIIQMTQQNSDMVSRIMPESQRSNIISSQRNSMRNKDAIVSHDDRLSGKLFGMGSEHSPLSSPS